MSDWQADMLSRIRGLIMDIDPEIVEEAKWTKKSNPLGVPVWSHHGIVCTGETYKDKIKLTFFRGAVLADPSGLMNAVANGGTRRAIDLVEGDMIDEAEFKALVMDAVQANHEKRK